MKQHRNDKTLERGEYLSRTREFATRGQDLPQSKLIELDIVSIHSAARQRHNLRQHIANTLSNEALSKQFGVHIRTIEKVLSRETWGHIA